MLCDVDALQPGVPVLAGPDAARPHGGTIVLRLEGGGVVAYRNRCPHRGIPLDRDAARLLGPGGRHLRCTEHDARFRLADGLCVAGPCEGRHLVPVAIRVEHGRVVTDD